MEKKEKKLKKSIKVKMLKKSIKNIEKKKVIDFFKKDKTMKALPPVKCCVSFYSWVLTPKYNIWHGIVGAGSTVRLDKVQEVEPVLNSAINNKQ